MTDAQTNTTDEVVDKQWMVRPCVIYEDEYKECNSYSGRAHQKYVYGQKANCDKWLADWKSCVKYEGTNDLQHLVEIIEHEKERQTRRLKAAAANTVWEYRTSPPKHWATPLPDDLKLQQVHTSDRFVVYEQRDVSSNPSTTSKCIIL